MGFWSYAQTSATFRSPLTTRSRTPHKAVQLTSPCARSSRELLLLRLYSRAALWTLPSAAVIVPSTIEALVHRKLDFTQTVDLDIFHRVTADSVFRTLWRSSRGVLAPLKAQNLTIKSMELRTTPQRPGLKSAQMELWCIPIMVICIEV